MASVLKVDKLDPQSGTALEIGTSGDTITVPSGATLDISSATLTPPATLPASSGVNLTALNATNLGSGTVPTARLGTGTASSSTVLYGDQTYKAEPGGGKLLKTATGSFTTSMSTNADAGDSNVWVVFETLTDFTPSSSDSDIVVTLVVSTGQVRITDGDFSFRLVVGGTTVDWRMMFCAWEDDHYARNFGPDAFRGVYPNTATDPLTITFDRLIHGSVTGDEKVEINEYGKTAWWTVEEWDTS